MTVVERPWSRAAVRAQAPNRITRDEFVMPPEFRDVRPTGHEAARVGGARIELVRASHNGSGAITRLGSCYQQIPVRLMPPFDLDDEVSLLYLINLTAGLLDGDGHLIELTARKGTRTVVTGQSATRVHPAVSSFSTQQWDVDVADDACLVVLPGPTIPYRNARYFQRGRVEMAPTAKVIWGDIWLAGRYERGDASERFVFDRLVQDFEARRSGQLVYRDRFRWDGPWSSDDIDWHFGRDNLASGSLFLSEPLPAGALPEPVAGLRQASFDLDTGASCVRWCGPPGAVTTALVRTALTAAARWTIGPDAAPWLLGHSELTPNHWFSTPPG